jgi:predicted nucleic acid-binding protein
MRTAIVDTGPLVAFLDRAEQNHRWVVAQIEKLDPPLLVCEPVLAEAMYLLARFAGAQNALFGLLENGALRIAFSIDEHVPPCANCIRNIGTDQCRWLMRASCEWPRFTSSTPC